MSLLKENSIFKITMLLLLCIITTITLQNWVGEQTIYCEGLKQKRLALHKAIYDNKLPDGKNWKDFGANGTNVRIFVVYAVGYMHELTGISIHHLYRIVDTIFLFFCFVAIFFYIRRWLDNSYCLIGLLYFGFVLIMTYYFHYFAPWDRISLFTWIALLYLIREKNDVLFTLLLIISITIKYDVIVLPLLYLFYNYSKGERSKVVLKTLLLLTVAFGLYEVMNYCLPSSSTGETHFYYFELFKNMTNRIFKNVRYFVGHNIAYPPLLMFAIPCIFSMLDWDKKDRFMKSSVIFAFILMMIHISATNCWEVRSETMVLVLLLPSALYSLKIMLESDDTVGNNQRELMLARKKGDTVNKTGIE